MITQFIKSYWDYYLELEAQLIETKRYVEFSDDNKETYSLEYLKLFQAVCSEIDVVGKEIAKKFNPNFNVDKSCTIMKWGFELQKQLGAIKDELVLFNTEVELHPFQNWQYEMVPNKNGNYYLRMVGGDNNVIKWWKDYNGVKHQRVGLVENNGKFHLANQKNLILAFSALFLMESMFIDFLKLEEKEGELSFEKSKLFRRI
jgi:hypothetical protein